MVDRWRSQLADGPISGWADPMIIDRLFDPTPKTVIGVFPSRAFAAEHDRAWHIPPRRLHSRHQLATMDFFQWHWWAGLALVLMIAEIFVPGFFLLCLGIGCAGASVIGALGFGPSVQLLVFSALSLVAFFTVRPLLMKRMWTGPDVKTNVDALVGQHGKVSQDFDPGLRLGRVAVGGDDWRAESVNDQPLRTGDLIKVVRVESNTLVVKPIDH
jgi:membrane protein implicated in regulation of membrane protease activity